MLFNSLLILLCVLSCAFAQQWTLDSSSAETTLVGVGAGETQGLAIAAAAANGVGAIAEIFMSEKWTKNRVQAGLLLDGSISNTGLSVLTSMGEIFVSSDSGKSFTPVPWTFGISQSSSIFNSGSSIGLAGTFTSNSTGSYKQSSGVATSNDGGKTWNLSGNMDMPRYGAFPSANTWYVSAGTWGDDASTLSEEEKGNKIFRLGRRATVQGKSTSSSTLDKESLANQMKKRKNSATDGDDGTGWFGSIYKTTDAGATWTEVFTSPSDSYYYFNAISCSSETLCVAVAEGQNADGSDLTIAFTTNDGGATWTQTYTGSDFSLMATTFVPGTQTAWLAPVQHKATGMTGQFYQSTDGGQTWKLYQSVSNCYPFDLAFSADGSNGFASCGSSSGGSSQVAIFTA